MKRRAFIERSAAIALLAFLRPADLMATWNGRNFQQVPLEKALIDVLGTKDLVRTGRITVTAPAAASDATSVPVEINSDIKGDAIYLFVEKNVTPLVFSCSLHEGALAYFSLNVKMKESSLLYAVVRENGKYYMASAQVNVSAEAC
ncbi:MAG: thiosulfate-binding protein SoxY [Chlorobi bacterium]|jgi:sulfur-oxidizing protein SoxY|nr:thiosulfate-binding protein SoxY [Chlorobiota bacterium]